MQILLVLPKLVEKAGDYYPFPIGIPSISAALKRENFNVHCINLNHTDEPVEAVIKKEIVSKGIDVVCSGGLSREYGIVKAVFDASRKVKKDVITVAGGGLISSEPQLMADALPIDFGVVGEGEVTVVKLMKAIQTYATPHDVEGIVFKEKNGRVVQTKTRELIQDLDILPYPDLQGFGMEEYLDFQLPNDTYFMYPFDRPRFISMTLSRSCPFHCTFCYHPLGKKYRQRSLDSFFHELETHIANLNINMISIIDELFLVDMERAEAFCERIATYGVKWIASMRVDRITDSILYKLKQSGMVSICYGLESASDKVLKSMKKRITFSQIENAYRATKATGLAFTGNLLIGDPAETRETASKTIDWWVAHQKDFVNIHTIIPYPGSALYQYCLDKGLIKDKLEYIRNGCPSVNMTQMTDDDISQINYEIVRGVVVNRQYGKNISVKHQCISPYRNIPLYQINLTCPHCNSEMSYINFHRDDEISVIKIGCKVCHQRIYLMPKYFDHINQKIAPFVRKIAGLQQSGRPVSVSPCVFEYSFIEYMNIFDMDYKKLNLKYFLDAMPNPAKVSYDFLKKYPLLKRTKENIALNCKGHAVIVLPCGSYGNIVESLRQSGVEEEDLFYIPFDGA